MFWGRVRNKKLGWAIVMACIAATSGVAVYGVASISHQVTPTKRSVFTESLQATYLGYNGYAFRVNLLNNGNESVTTTGGTCSSGYCLLQPPEIAVDGNITVDFDGAPPSGPTEFNVTTFQGKSFSWNTSSPAFNPYLGRETLMLDSYDGYFPTSNVYVYWLNLTNTGPVAVTITGGSCTNTSCAAASSVTLSPNVVTPVRFASANPCPGNITLTATTAFENIFNFYVKAC